MIALVQRVSKATVKSLESKKTNNINSGACVLLGVSQEDTEKDVEKIVKKLVNLRIFKDKDNKMNLNSQDVQAEILLVSQFTLLSNVKKGNRPSFIKAAKPKEAQELYKAVAKGLRDQHLVIKEGFFGHYMELELTLDGTVTIHLNSKDL